MMQPPSEFDSLISGVETLKILLIAFMSAIVTLLVVLMFQLRSAGNKLSHLMNILLAKPMVGLTRKAFDELQQQISESGGAQK